jgi:hypothetical protein
MSERWTLEDGLNTSSRKVGSNYQPRPRISPEDRRTETLISTPDQKAADVDVKESYVLLVWYIGKSLFVDSLIRLSVAVSKMTGEQWIRKDVEGNGSGLFDMVS